MLFDTFGTRVIGLQITRDGDGMNAGGGRSRKAVCRFTPSDEPICSNYFHGELQSDQVRFADGPAMRRAYEQLANLEVSFVKAERFIPARRAAR